MDFYEKNGIGVINASPLCMGLLNNEASPPEWHLAPGITQDFVKKAAELCKKRNADLGKIFMSYVNFFPLKLLADVQNVS